MLSVVFKNKAFPVLLFLMLLMCNSNKAFSAVTCPQATGASGTLLNIDADYNSCINGNYIHPITGFSAPSNGFKVVRYSNQPNSGSSFPNIFPLAFYGYYQTEQNWEYRLACSGTGCANMPGNGVYGNWVYCEGTCNITFKYRRNSTFNYSVLNCLVVATQNPRSTTLNCSAKGGMFFQTGDDDSQLSSLSLSTGTLSPAFTAGTLNYAHSTILSSTSITAKPSI